MHHHNMFLETRRESELGRKKSDNWLGKKGKEIQEKKNDLHVLYCVA